MADREAAPLESKVVSAQEPDINEVVSILPLLGIPSDLVPSTVLTRKSVSAKAAKEIVLTEELNNNDLVSILPLLGIPSDLVTSTTSTKGSTLPALVTKIITSHSKSETQMTPTTDTSFTDKETTVTSGSTTPTAATEEDEEVSCPSTRCETPALLEPTPSSDFGNAPITLNPLTIPSDALKDVADVAAMDIAFKVLRIIHRYRMEKAEGTTVQDDEGRLKFLAIIYSHVKAERAIPMCLPAFPFKSPNTKYKVLGKLPDKGEEFALANLNGLCEAINSIYPHGCKLTIISDGLVYNDLLSVPDRDVWNYGQALRKMAVDKGYKNIAFSRLRDLVAIPVPDHLDEMTYVANASNFRRAMLNTFASPDWNWEEFSKSEDVRLTYRGYLKFLETDLAIVYPLSARTNSKYKQGLKYIAQQMLARGEAFANAVKQKYPSHVRLSIHASTGAAKLSVSPLPTTSMFTTPWHCSVGFLLDGTMVSGKKGDFEDDEKFEVVHENGQPSYFREKSDLYNWEGNHGGIVTEPIYPSGLIIRPAAGHNALHIEDIDASKVRALAEIISPIVLRGFRKSTKRCNFVEAANRLGTPAPWKFGLVLEVKAHGENSEGLNNVLSSEWVPFHFDGLFKTKEEVTSQGEKRLVPKPPRFQFFTAINPSPHNTGCTLFSSSTQFFRHLPQWLTPEHMRSMTWNIKTSSSNATSMSKLPLVVDHPTTGKPCLRYHEPWQQSKTKFEAIDVSIDDQDEINNAAICTAIDETLHDRRVSYWHAWEKGDLVISDNTLVIHARSSFNPRTSRELWRIHIN